MPGGQRHSPTAVLHHHTYLIVDATIVILLLLLYKLQLRLQSNKVQHQRLGFGLFFGCELEREGEGESMSHRHRRSELFIFSEEKIFCVFENFITSSTLPHLGKNHDRHLRQSTLPPRRPPLGNHELVRLPYDA